MNFEKNTNKSSKKKCVLLADSLARDVLSKAVLLTIEKGRQ